MDRIDMMGYKSGKLTVIAEAPKRGHRYYWKCICECGRETIVESYRIRKELTKSCGYCGSGGKKLDLTGQRFGKLIAVRLSDKRSVYNEIYWHCKCDCGNETDVRIGHLTSGKILSCGCIRKGAPNEYEVVGDIVYVKINNRSGKDRPTMICDADDWERLKDYRWCLDGNGYACTANYNKELKYDQFHRNVIDIEKGLVADHINRNRLDNRKCNLRVVTIHANTVNRSVSKKNTTGYTGITKRANGKWQARITVNGCHLSLGTYKDIDKAIEARKEAEEKYFKPLFEVSK